MLIAAPVVAETFADALRAHREGRLLDAERLYRTTLMADPRHADSLHMLGVIAHQSGREDAALDLIARALALNPEIAECHFHLGIVHGQHGRPAQAAECFARAVALKPDLAEAHSNLGHALGQLGRLEEAAACCREAIRLRPDFMKAHYNLAAALGDLGRLEEAVACCRNAVARRPRDAEAHHALAVTLRQFGALDEAAASSRRAIELRPDYPEAHFNLAEVLLARGDLAAGWLEYEWRWQTAELRAFRRGFPQPQWRGEPAAGRTLLLYSEQGFGDTLQFCRYAMLAASRGLRVVMQVQPPLVRLLRSLPRVDRVVGPGEPLPDFDLQCPMLSMPLALGTSLENVPGGTCYLRADAADVAAWGERLGGMAVQGLRVGLAWAGSARLHAPGGAAFDRRRSIAAERLAPLFGVAGLHWVSLQKTGAAAPAGLPLTDLMEDAADFADTAALVQNLDLVISVDTAVAHLAAALGRPVWLLNRFDSDWRWLTGRRDSPWYPTLRQYRQPSPGDWDSVLSEVARDLRRVAASGRLL